MHKQETVKNLQHLATPISAVYSFLLSAIFTIMFNLDMIFIYLSFVVFDGDHCLEIKFAQP